ncbi:MAG: PorT family protein [Prevotella sp.]|nr:PorT family protein [Prevotella sp.]
MRLLRRIDSQGTCCLAVLLLVFLLPLSVAQAQVGEHRSELSLGVNGGYVMSNMGFVPKIPQGMHTGLTGGMSFRYTSEKYFNSICAVVAELNYAQIGWKESILTKDDEPVINAVTGVAEEFQRTISYLQIPVFARLGWGRERRGFQAFFQIGPQIGYYLSESDDSNFDVDNPNVIDRTSIVSSSYTRDGVKVGSGIYHMPVENKIDYGIAGGAGLEFSHPKLGHFLLEGRYYYGLGNIYGDSKRDYFGRSNFSNILVKLTYLVDILKTNNPKIK